MPADPSRREASRTLLAGPPFKFEVGDDDTGDVRVVYTDLAWQQFDDPIESSVDYLLTLDGVHDCLRDDAHVVLVWGSRSGGYIGEALGSWWTERLNALR